MLQDYRQEKWYTIFTEILIKTIQSASLAANVNEFVSSSVEALSPNIKISLSERQQILENLWKIFNVSLNLTNLTLIKYKLFYFRIQRRPTKIKLPPR